MADQPLQIMLHLNAGGVADADEQAQLSQRLRLEIRELDVDAVDWVRAGDAPAGAKGDVATLGTLAVTLAPTLITPLMGMLSSWLSRHERASVTVESGGQKLVVTGSPSAQQQQLVEAFIKQSKGAAGS